MAFSRQQIRDSIERAGEAHWQALIRHHEDAYPESPPTESRVERTPPAVRITLVFEDREKGTRFETEPFTGYE